MNVNEIVENIIRQILNERFDTFNIASGQVDNMEFLSNQLNFYVNTFPQGTKNYAINYSQMTQQQREIMGSIASCMSQSIEMITNKVYREFIYPKTYKEQGRTPEDLMMDFLGGGVTKDVLRNNKKAPSKSESAYGLPVVVGKYLNNCAAKHIAINGRDARNYILASVRNIAIKIFRDEYRSLDSPKRSDLVRPASNAVSYNDAFANEPNIDITNIINDKKIGLGPQEKLMLQTLADINGSKMSRERLDTIINSTPTKQNVEIYKEISDRTGIDLKNVQRSISAAFKKAKQSVYATMPQPKQVTNSIPNPQPKQVTNTIPKPQQKKVTNSIPKPQPTKTQKVLKPAQPKSNKNIDNSNYNGWNYTVSESNNRNKNKQNMKKVLVTESVLKSLIIRALNESIFEADKPGNAWESIKKWALAVRNGANPLHCQEFSDFYMSLVENPYCENAVKMGFAYESKNQSTVGSNTTLKIDKLFATKPKIASDVITDFFTGENCMAKEDSKPDSFVGDNVINCAKAALNGSENDFFNVLCKQLRIYGSHYCRKHYGELSVQWGLGAQQIGGDKSSAFEDEEGNDMEVYDELGNKINTSDEANRDAYSGENKEQSDAEFEKTTSNSDDKYFNRMINLVEKMVADKNNNLAPQERNILQCVVDIARTGVSPERLNQMEGLSDTQKRMVIYDEAAERLGISVDNLKRSLSSAINKARQSKYAKMLEEQKKLKEQLIKAVMNEVIARYSKN